MVDRYIEESLYLVGMEIHGDDTVHTSHTEDVCHQFGADAHSGLVLAVLTCPTEIGHHGIDGTGGGTFGSVYHQQKFHEIVAVGKSALHKEHVAPADGLLIGDGELTVGEMGDLQLAKGTVEAFADFLCQIAGGSA